jgi:protein-disulfide isomerase
MGSKVGVRPAVALALLLLGLLLGGCEDLFLRPLIADFTGSPRWGTAPLEVQFEDLSRYALRKPIVSWEWDFGDGAGSGEQHPRHTYTEPGRYTVSLAVVDEAGREDVVTEPDYIVVVTEEEPPTVVLPPTKGSPEAKVTMVEFSDFLCPFCAQFAIWTLPKIEEEYVETGKVKLIFRNLPIHGEVAARAAEAALCAHEQGQFWEYHDRLFADSLNRGRKAFTPENLVALAVELGLDGEGFELCLDSRRYSSAVEEDIAEGKRLGVQGTPTFFINDRKIVGAQPYENFRRVIEEELGKG